MLIVRVLIADAFEQSGLSALEAGGCEVVYRPELKDAALAGALKAAEAQVLVVRSTKVTAEMLQSPALALVVRAGAGYNTIDVGTASRRGIYVANCPGKNSIAVAELTFGLILALDRRIPDNVNELRAGRWNKKEFSKARGLHGRTLGVLGFGSIGQEVAKRGLASGMKVVVWSRRFSEHGTGTAAIPGAGLAGGSVEIARAPADVAAVADVLSIHLALTSDTRRIVDAGLLARMPPGACLVNTARAELVDEQALEAAIRDRGLRVAVDVFAHEPEGSVGDFADPMVTLPHVYGTHHIGASTEQAQEAIAAESVRIVLEYKDTGTVRNVVNLCTRTPATYTLIVRHLDRPGVLAHVFEHLRRGDINVQETDNVIFEGAEAAVARINVDRRPSEALLDAIHAGSPHILDLHLVTL
jgi:D-3-phosphoglycerate dehydrogenase / 2-oxoglutarate reductase